MGEPFTLLLPVYHGDDPEFFRTAYRSATVDQTLPPDFVIIVQDGPVDAALDAVLRECERDPATTVVRLPENRGLAEALSAGLARVTTQIVARADADDVCLPDRFAIQVPIVSAGVDVVGSSIAEFETDPDVRGRVRLAETDSIRLLRGARFECPFFHPTVVFRASAVAAAGGYRDLPLLEDYLLWGAMIQAGARVANCPEVLVAFRVGAGAYGRRGGARVLRSEFRLQREFRRMGFTNQLEFFRNLVVRCGYRLVPEPVRRSVYRARLWSKAGSGSGSGSGSASGGSV